MVAQRQALLAGDGGGKNLFDDAAVVTASSGAFGPGAIALRA